MTILLVAAGVVGLLVAAGVIARESSSKGDVLAFTSPDHLAAGMRQADKPTNMLIPEDDDSKKHPAGQDDEAAIPQRSQHDATALSPGNLGLDTQIVFGSWTGIVVGVLSFDYQGDVWHDYSVELNDGSSWRLMIDPVEEAEGYLKEVSAAQEMPVTLEPGASTLDFNGTAFSLERSGPANYRSIGKTGQFEAGRYWYYDYVSADHQLLSFERYDSGPWVTTTGRTVNPAEIRINNFLE